MSSRDCPTGKVSYTSAHQARKHVATKVGDRVRTYQCRHCGGVHVTTRDTAERGRDTKYFRGRIERRYRDEDYE